MYGLEICYENYKIVKDLWVYVDGTEQNPANDARALSFTVEENHETIFNDIRDLSSRKEAWKISAEIT